VFFRCRVTAPSTSPSPSLRSIRCADHNTAARELLRALHAASTISSPDLAALSASGAFQDTTQARELSPFAATLLAQLGQQLFALCAEAATVAQRHHASAGPDGAGTPTSASTPVAPDSPSVSHHAGPPSVRALLRSVDRFHLATLGCRCAFVAVTARLHWLPAGASTAPPTQHGAPPASGDEEGVMTRRRCPSCPSCPSCAGKSELRAGDSHRTAHIRLGIGGDEWGAVAGSGGDDDADDAPHAAYGYGRQQCEDSVSQLDVAVRSLLRHGRMFLACSSSLRELSALLEFACVVCVTVLFFLCDVSVVVWCVCVFAALASLSFAVGAHVTVFDRQRRQAGVWVACRRAATCGASGDLSWCGRPACHLPRCRWNRETRPGGKWPAPPPPQAYNSCNSCA